MPPAAATRGESAEAGGSARRAGRRCAELEVAAACGLLLRGASVVAASQLAGNQREELLAPLGGREQQVEQVLRPLVSICRIRARLAPISGWTQEISADSAQPCSDASRGCALGPLARRRAAPETFDSSTAAPPELSLEREAVVAGASRDFWGVGHEASWWRLTGDWSRRIATLSTVDGGLTT